MLRLGCSIVLLSLCSAAISQTAASDEALLIKTRALYDAPFSRGLVSFDCAVGFDWKEHFTDLFGTVPPAAVPAIERLQAIQHRAFVDLSGATVSAIPKAPDLSGVAHGPELEQALQAMVSGGLNGWLPFSTNVILPTGKTKFNFEKIDSGYKLVINGPDVAATLLLGDGMRLTSAVSQLPQPMRFSSEFTEGPNGFLLEKIKTGSTTDTASIGEATFTFTYQSVQGLQLPSSVAIVPVSKETWHYALTDCKVRKGVMLEVSPPDPLIQR
jgi:hypothetical protein